MCPRDEIHFLYLSDFVSSAAPGLSIVTLSHGRGVHILFDLVILLRIRGVRFLHYLIIFFTDSP